MSNSKEDNLLKLFNSDMRRDSLLMYFSIPFLTSPRAPMTTEVVVVFMPDVLSMSISRYLYLDRFSAVFKEVFLSVGQTYR